MKIVVCGGGIMGTCVAYYLHEQNVQVTVIERNDVACAASGKAGGFLAEDWCKSNETLNSFAGASFKLHKELSEKLNGTAVYDYRPLKAYSLNISLTEHKSDKQGEEQLNWIDGTTVNEQTTELIGTTETIAQLHPYKFVTCLSNINKENGVEILNCESMSGLLFEDDVVKGVKLASGNIIYCDKVVLCMGPWTGLAEQWLKQCPSVYGQKAHSITVKPAAMIPDEAIFTEHSDISPEFYPRPDGEVYICGLAENPVGSSIVPSSEDVRPTQGSCEKLKFIADKLSSSFSNSPVKISQACYMPLTQDGLPLVGKLDGVTGLYMATGHGCWGILNGPITGKMMAELVTSGKTSLDINAFSPNRFF